MHSLAKHLLCLICAAFYLTPALDAKAILPNYANDLSPSTGHWIVTGNDPYLIFPIQEAGDKTQPWISLSFGDGLSEALYFEFFWEIDQKGFAETQKASFTFPIDTAICAINLEQLGDLFDFQASAVTQIRIDPLLPPGKPIQIFANRGLPDAAQSAPVIEPHYPMNPDEADIGLPLAMMNSMGVLNNQLKIFNGDPHLVFDLSGQTISQDTYLVFEMTPEKRPTRTYTYIELFWANQAHGFTEAHKAFFMHSFSEAWNPVLLNIGERIASLGEPLEGIHALRVDFHYPFEPAFSLNLDMIDKNDANFAGKTTTLKYTTKPTFIQQANIAKSACTKSLKEFSGKLMHDLWFSISYVMLIAAFAGCLIYSCFRVRRL